MTETQAPAWAQPAAGMVHPGAISALLVLAANDHWGKTAWPGFCTGKLSDFAGLAFFPLFLQALAELCGAPVSRRVLAGACVLTAVVFAAVKVWPPMHTVYEVGLGWAQFPVRALVVGATAPVPVQLEADPTDLMALPAVGCAWMWRKAWG